MKKTLLLFLSIFTFGTLFSQVPANKTVYDCAGNSKNIYATLATGKSIIIAHKGVDCSICRNTAPGWQTWAAANTTNVEVWGAITYSFSSSAFPTSSMCILTNRWKSTYAWNDIFTFPDSSRSWYQGASPRYFVYSAIDSSIVYQGSSSTLARNHALAQSTVGINSSILKDAKVFNFNGQLIIKNLPTDVTELNLFNANAQLVLQQSNALSNRVIDVSEFEKGIYILQFNSPRGTESKKLIFQ